jgi:hypothetical protein
VIRASTLSSVVLPAPFGPIRPSAWSFGTEKLMSRSAHKYASSEVSRRRLAASVSRSVV